MAKYLEELLITNKPGEPMAWHAVIGEEAPEGWDGPPKMHKALRPDQVQAQHGLDLTGILGIATAEALRAASEARQAAGELQGKVDEQEAAIALLGGIVGRYRAFLVGIGQSSLVERIEAGAMEESQPAPGGDQVQDQGGDDAG